MIEILTQMLLTWFFTLLHNGECTHGCRIKLKEGLGSVLRALPAGSRGGCGTGRVITPFLGLLRDPKLCVWFLILLIPHVEIHPVKPLKGQFIAAGGCQVPFPAVLAFCCMGAAAFR